MNETSMYYALSTVAQTTATYMAIVVAFLLFRGPTLDQTAKDRIWERLTVYLTAGCTAILIALISLPVIPHMLASNRFVAYLSVVVSVGGAIVAIFGANFVMASLFRNPNC